MKHPQESNRAQKTIREAPPRSAEAVSEQILAEIHSLRISVAAIRQLAEELEHLQVA
jgi:hypothetical protein